MTMEAHTCFLIKIGLEIFKKAKALGFVLDLIVKISFLGTKVSQKIKKGGSFFAIYRWQ